MFDNRGSAELLGFVLMFSLVATSFALYQADVVPHQNREEEEVGYSEAVASELTDVASTAREVGTSGAPASPTLPGGATYPDRALAINAPPPSGHLRTTERYAVTVGGFSTTYKQYWNGTNRTYDTR